MRAVSMLIPLLAACGPDTALKGDTDTDPAADTDDTDGTVVVDTATGFEAASLRITGEFYFDATAGQARAITVGTDVVPISATLRFGNPDADWTSRDDADNYCDLRLTWSTAQDAAAWSQTDDWWFGISLDADEATLEDTCQAADEAVISVWRARATSGTWFLGVGPIANELSTAIGEGRMDPYATNAVGGRVNNTSLGLPAVSSPYALGWAFNTNNIPQTAQGDPVYYQAADVQPLSGEGLSRGLYRLGSLTLFTLQP